MYDPASDPAKVRLSLSQMAEALRRTKLQQIVREYVSVDDKGNVVTACAVGAIAHELGVNHDKLYEALEGCNDDLHYHLGDDIVDMNDRGLLF